MHWWEEAEARAQRAKSPAAMAQSLWQRLQGAGVDSDLAFGPAYDLAHLYDLCADLVKLTESLLESADGDRAALRRHGIALTRWARFAAHWAQSSAPGFNQLIDSLDLDADRLAEREQPEVPQDGGSPEERGKVDGRYRYWHLLYERLDLKLASIGVEEAVRQALARSLSRLYEHALATIRLLGRLEKEQNLRFGGAARLLLEINTTWHFDLGPYHLGPGELRVRGQMPPGLQTWLLLAFR